MCIFVGYVWKTDSALSEMELGFAGVKQGLFAKIWPIFIKFICPLVIAYNVYQGILGML
jgi:NSS family neurotransmitter:Na+ symporter